MKKLTIGLLFAALAVCGLVGVAPSATAADPYPGTVQTTLVVKAKKKVVVGKKGKVKATVTASGNVSPTGKVQVKVKRVGGGFTFKQTRTYTGGTLKFKTRALKKPGRYKVKVKYVPTAGSVFAPSKAKTSFKVLRKR